MPRPDRRALIADAALELAATGGNHAVTHRGVDRSLDLPKGSTSYYFRSREALVDAAAQRLVWRSRKSFDEAIVDGGVPVDVMAAYVADLVDRRRTDVLARQALLLDPTLAEDTRDRLRGCLFSAGSARRLLVEHGSSAPDDDARRLLAILEGVVFVAHSDADARRDIEALVAAAFPSLA